MKQIIKTHLSIDEKKCVKKWSNVLTNYGNGIKIMVQVEKGKPGGIW